MVRKAMTPEAIEMKAARASVRAKRLTRAQENLVHVRRGTCPDCGAKLRRNLSMDGWYQCEQLGAPGFRADAEKPHCDFQFFYTRDDNNAMVAARGENS